MTVSRLYRGETKTTAATLTAAKRIWSDLDIEASVQDAVRTEGAYRKSKAREHDLAYRETGG